jgi:hypothetical protein
VRWQSVRFDNIADALDLSHRKARARARIMRMKTPTTSPMNR